MMNQVSWQRPWIRAATTLLTLAVMISIFSFSSENAEASDATSGVFARAVISVLYPEYDRETPEQQRRIYDDVQHYVRKSAHFLIYLILGGMIRLCLFSWFGRFQLLNLAAWGCGTLFSVTDELHQLLIDGHSGQWTDVLLDSAGVMTGVIIARLFITFTERIYRRKHPNDRPG